MILPRGTPGRNGTSRCKPSCLSENSRKYCSGMKSGARPNVAVNKSVSDQAWRGFRGSSAPRNASFYKAQNARFYFPPTQYQPPACLTQPSPTSPDSAACRRPSRAPAPCDTPAAAAPPRAGSATAGRSVPAGGSRAGLHPT